MTVIIKHRSIYWVGESGKKYTAVIDDDVEPGISIGNKARCGLPIRCVDFERGIYGCLVGHEHSIPQRWVEVDPSCEGKVNIMSLDGGSRRVIETVDGVEVDRT